MPYDNPIKKKGSSCMQMKDYKGKTTGLMMEGSLAYEESLNPDLAYGGDVIDETAQDSVVQMSPYKMDHGSVAEQTEKPKIDLKSVKEKAQQLQSQKTADSLKSIQDFKVADSRLPFSREQYVSSGQEHLLKEIDKKAGEKYAKKVYDFDIIQPTKEFPKTGVSWKKSTYSGSGYNVGQGERSSEGLGRLPSTLAKQKLSGYEQDRAKKIVEYGKRAR